MASWVSFGVFDFLGGFCGDFTYVFFGLLFLGFCFLGLFAFNISIKPFCGEHVFSRFSSGKAKFHTFCEVNSPQNKQILPLINSDQF